MTFKKILSLLVVMTMLFSSIGITALAEETTSGAELPEAQVENLGKIKVSQGEGQYSFEEEYYEYDLIGSQKLSSATEAFDLNIAMQFISKDTPEEAAANFYGQYTTDFFIKIDGLKDGSFVGNGCYLAGYYPTFGAWVKIPLDGFTVEDGVVYPVITSANFDFKYTDICASVKNFICGIYLTPEVLEANPDINVNLTLGLSETMEDALKGDFEEVDSYKYTIKDFAVASIDDSYYTTFAGAVAAAQEGDTITLLSDTEELSEAVTLPADTTLCGNGYEIKGTVSAGGDLTIEGHTKIQAFSAGYYNRTITIGKGACLEVTGTGRVSLGYGNVFNITGSIENAKASVNSRATYQPSLIIPGGISITGGNDAAMNVKDAYVVIGSTTSKNSAANGTFELNFENSVAEFTNQLTFSEPTNGMNPTFEINVEDSILTTATKLCIAAPNTTMVVDNSIIDLGTYIRNSGEITLTNGSSLTGKTIQFGENGGNDGKIIVDNSDLEIIAGSEGHALDGKGEGVIILKNGATANVDYIKDSLYSVDSSSTLTTTKEIDCSEYKEPVAKIGDTGYASVTEALDAAYNAGMKDVVITLTGDTDKNTTDTVDLYNKYGNGTAFNKITFRQEDGSKSYYLKTLYTGWTNNKVVFDGVNIVVTEQLYAIGKVELINNSTITRSSGTTNFVFYGDMFVQPGSKFISQVDRISSGSSLTVDGGRTDGNHNSTADYKTVWLYVENGNTMTIKNGAYVIVSNYEYAELDASGTVDVQDSRLDVFTAIRIGANGVFKVNANSIVNTNQITGTGKIAIDATGMPEGEVAAFKKVNMTGFTGAIELANSDGLEAEIVDGRLVLKKVVLSTLSGTGTEEDPFLINNIDDLILFRDSVNAGETKYNAAGVYVALGADIDMAGIDWNVNIGDDCNTTFDGIFDGKNHTISNLTATETAQKGDGYICTGLFGAIYETAQIKNLTIKNATINAGNYKGSNVGVVVGFAYNETATIENVKVIGDIKVDAPKVNGVGTIVGYAYYGNPTIKNCEVIANEGSYINASSETGGIVGYGGAVDVVDCKVENLAIEADGLIGGITGLLFEGGAVNGGAVNNVELTVNKDVWKNSAAIAVGTIASDAISVSGVEYSDVTENGEATSVMVGSAYAEQPTTVVPAVQAKVGDKYYTTIKEAFEAAQNGDTVTVIADIENVAVDVDKDITITGNVSANNVSINAVEGCSELTVSNLSFTGNSWINSGAAGKLTVEGVKANVTPSNASATNSRSAFISLGRIEAKELELTVKDCNIVSAGGSDPILGWATITKATLTGNTFGSPEAYQSNSDSVKFMAIADGAEFTVTDNTVYSNYNGLVFGQNTTRGNKYTVVLENNKFLGGADHVWIEVSGAKTTHATINANSNNTVNGSAFTASDIKVHPNITTWTSYAGVDVVTNENGKVIGGQLAFNAEDIIAEGYEKDANGFVIVAVKRVAEVNGIKYETFAEAYATAKNGDTITLLDDVKLTGKLTIDKAITLDGNGHSIIADETAVWYTTGFIKQYKTHLIGVNASNITLKNIVLDNNDNAAGINIYCAQNVVFDNVSIINATKGMAAITVNGSTLTLKNKFEALGNSIAMDISNGSGVTSPLGVTVEEGTVLNLDNKTVKFASVAVNDMSGAVTAEGKPYFAAMDVACYYTENQINSRTTAFSNGLTLLDDVELTKEISVKGTLDLNGNTITIADGKVINVTGNLTVDTESGTINGKFNLDSATATITAAEGLDVTTNIEGYKVVYEDGKYSLKQIVYVAQVGDTKYTSLHDSIAAANAGETVTILANEITFDKNAASIVIDKAITIEGAGKAETKLIFDSATSAFVIKSSDVTIKNMTIVQGTADNSAHISIDKGAWDAPKVQYSGITIENVEFVEGDNALFLIGENVVVDSCSFIGQESHNIVVYSLKGDNKITNNVFGKSDSNNKSAILYEGGADNATDLSGFIGGGTLTIDGNEAYSKGTFFQFTSWGLVKNMNVSITDNYIDAFTNKAIAIYDMDGALTAAGDEFASFVINENVFTNVPAGRPIVKEYTGTVTVDANSNYLGSAEPDYEALLVGDKVEIENYYGSFANEDGVITLSDLVEIKGAVATVTDAEGKITKYETLAEAFAAANEGDTVTLLSDIELAQTITVANGKKITLDLNGKTITGTDTTSKNFSLIDNRGDLTITGDGKMTLTATVNSGWNRYSAVLANNPGGKLTIESGIFEHLGGTDMAYGIDNLTNGKGTYAETIINGGTIKSTYRGIRQFLNGVEAQNILTVNGGTVEGANKSIWMQDPSTKANTGTLTVGENAKLIGDVYLFVTAGSTQWPVEVSIAAAALEEGSTVVTGNVPEKYDVKEINGTYGVYDVVAKIGNVKFGTLQEAIDAANEGDTVTLISDIELAQTVTVASDKNITLDLAGKTISQEKACSESYQMINNKGNLTITGEGKISFKDTGAGDPGFGWGSYTIRNEGTLVVENGTIEHLGEQNVTGQSAKHMYCAIFQYSGSSTINGGVISTPTYRSVRLWKGDMTINDGTFDGQLWVQCVDDTSSLTINGGSFGPNWNDGSSVFIGNVTTAGAVHTAELNVTGGTFATKIGANNVDAITGQKIIGGTYTEAAVNGTNAALLAEGYEFTKNEDNTYGVTEEAEIELFYPSNINATLGNFLSLNLFYGKENFDGTDYYAEFIHQTATGEVSTRVDYEDWIQDGSFVRINYSGMAAKQMSDKVTITIYKGNGVKVSVPYETSLRDYALLYLGMHHEEEKTESVKNWMTALVDMLNYGAAAQTYFGYNVDNLANADTDKYQIYATSEDVELKRDVTGSGYLYSANLTLNERILYRAFFTNVTEKMFATIDYTDHYGVKQTATKTYNDFGKDGIYCTVVVDTLVIADASQPITITVYDGDKVHATITESANGCLARTIEDSPEDTAFSTLAQKLVNFAESARKTLEK